MVDSKLSEARLAKSCCARCTWWSNEYGFPMGRCQILDEPRWYQCMVCDEYEVDPDVQDTINLYLGEL